MRCIDGHFHRGIRPNSAIFLLLLVGPFMGSGLIAQEITAAEKLLQIENYLRRTIPLSMEEWSAKQKFEDEIARLVTSIDSLKATGSDSLQVRLIQAHAYAYHGLAFYAKGDWVGAQAKFDSAQVRYEDIGDIELMDSEHTFRDVLKQFENNETVLFDLRSIDLKNPDLAEGFDIIKHTEFVRLKRCNRTIGGIPVPAWKEPALPPYADFLTLTNAFWGKWVTTFYEDRGDLDSINSGDLVELPIAKKKGKRKIKKQREETEEDREKAIEQRRKEAKEREKKRKERANFIFEVPIPCGEYLIHSKQDEYFQPMEFKVARNVPSWSWLSLTRVAVPDTLYLLPSDRFHIDLSSHCKAITLERYRSRVGHAKYGLSQPERIELKNAKGQIPVGRYIVTDSNCNSDISIPKKVAFFFTEQDTLVKSHRDSLLAAREDFAVSIVRKDSVRMLNYKESTRSHQISKYADHFVPLSAATFLLIWLR